MAPDDVIARVGERTIRYREIRCDEVWIRQLLRARNDPRAPADACKDMEQARLDLLLTEELLDHAPAVARFALSDAEVAAQESPIVHDEAALARYLEFSLVLPQAIARVRNGEDADVVYAEALAPRGVARETFDSVSRIFDTKEKIDAYLAQDARERTLTTLRRTARRAAVAARLLADHRTQAETSGRSVNDIRREFWTNVLGITKTAIVADGYRLPNLEELP